MKTIDYQWGAQTLHLCLNAAALFDIYDKFGCKVFVTQHIEGNDKKSFDAACYLLSKLAEQGELVRRYQGHRACRIPTPEEFAARLAPLQYKDAKQAICDAVALGFARDEPEQPGDMDEGLAELERGDAGELSRAGYLATALRLGLGAREGMLLTLGQAADLLEVELRRRGKAREE